MNAAETHLEEMNDLAQRIIAMGNTIETRESEYEGGPLRVTASKLRMAEELAELVTHYKPENIYEQVLECLDDRGLNTAGLEAAMPEDNFWNAFGGPLLDDIERVYDLKYD